MKELKILFTVLFCVGILNCVAQEEEDFLQDLEIDSLQRIYFDSFASSPYDGEEEGEEGDEEEVTDDQEVPTPPARGGMVEIKVDNVESFNTTVPPKFLEYNLTEISARCPKDAFYSSYNPDHRIAVRSLTEIFMDQSNLKELLAFSEFSKKSSEIHPRVWYASYVRAQVVKMPDILDLDRPSSIELFPTSFFPAELLQQNSSNEDCLLLDERFGADNGIENRLWYMREDVQLNAHHWYWHLVNPARTATVIDRRGELFYYFHHELLARYIAERLSNGLKPTVPLNFQNDTILEEGYRPHLTDGISSLPWANRRPMRNVSELNPMFGEVVGDTKLFRDRVLDAINQGGIIHDDGFVEISEHDRTGLLADLTEASNRSINSRHYGTAGYHALVHWIIANVDVENDPGVGGVIGDVGTAVRDTMFWRWHEYIDVLFQSYKLSHLKPYSPTGGYLPLLFRGVKVIDVAVLPENIHGENVLVNQLETFWSVERFNLEGGLDFNTRSIPRSLNVSICAKHLDHQEFYYRMHIENDRRKRILATVRIFMAPRFKSQKRQTRYTMTEQRSLFFSMDSFQAYLQPGSNILIRRSIDSTLTAGWPKSFQELREELRTGQKLRTVCDCGFPHHLLLPKGNDNGMVFDLFLMVTDGTEDQVDDPPSDNENILKLNETCPPSFIHCGIPGKKYPDSRPMGYPFDRRPYEKPTIVTHPSGYQTIENRPPKDLEAYVKNIPNMHTSQVVIHHRNEIIDLRKYKIAN